MGLAPLDVSFRRGLRRNNLKNWYELVTRIASVHLVNQLDMFIWSLKNEISSVQSMYIAILNVEVPPINKFLWKLKLSLNETFP
jgi:hypothetical protein